MQDGAEPLDKLEALSLSKRRHPYPTLRNATRYFPVLNVTGAAWTRLVDFNVFDAGRFVTLTKAYHRLQLEHFRCELSLGMER